jgi:tetratricopeptide (TPR) repeat protein
VPRTLLALAVCLALPAAAQNAEVKKFVNAAITLYENLEYEKAMKQLTKAKLKASSPEDECRIALLEGIVLADMGREERALTAFKTGFGMDLEARLPVDVGPKVLAVAERARANVRKMLAPQIEAQRAEDERKAAEEKKRAEEVARLAAEEKKRAEEERIRNAPPPAIEKPKAQVGPSVRALSWIPGVIGLASAGVATGFLVSASGKYSALVKGTVDLTTAQNYRTTGATDATLGYVFMGVGIAGVVGAVTMFLFGAPTQVAIVPGHDGATLAFSGSFDLPGGAQ